MNLKKFLIPLLLLMIPIGVVNEAAEMPQNWVVLTADQVHTAVDIENAFHQATGGGTQPGIVVLDGSRGIFQYDPNYGQDFDINIFYSNLTLRGVNNAAIQGGGMFFDGMPLENIVIEHLWMNCPADCIISWGGPHRNIVLRDNHLIAAGYGIQVAETNDWIIYKNSIQAGGVAVDLIDGEGIILLNNRLGGNIPIMMSQCRKVKVINNSLLGGWEGLLIRSLSDHNQVIANVFSNVQHAGISLETDTHDNQIHGNKVTCASDTNCTIVFASENTWEDNNISGNKP